MASERASTNPITDKPLPCFVHHEDAGGQCERPATVREYGLYFCDVHGQDVRLGALSQEAHEAWTFFERFRNPEVVGFGGRIDAEIAAAASRALHERPSGDDGAAALLRAYPEAPPRVKEDAAADDSPEGPTLYDSCQDAIYLLHRCTRIASEDGQTWLVEMLEYEREGSSALAAEAVRRQGRDGGAEGRPAG